MAFLDFLPLIGDVVSGLFGNKATSSANATNLQLNRENNEANRQNMERQNQMNIEQWNRENAYNHPAAQMGRFTAAGLNPNLIYGQTNTAPQLSGSLGSTTSQAGSVMPNDAMSKMFGKLGETLMRIPMYREEVRGMRLENDLKEQRLKRAKEDDDFTSFLRYFDPDIPGDQMLSPKWSEYKNSVAGRRVLEEFDELWFRNYKESLNLGAYEYEAEARKIDALLSRDLKKQVAAVARNMDVPTEDFETVAKAMIYSARGLKADALLKEAEAILSDPSFIEKLPQGLPALARFLRMLLK